MDDATALQVPQGKEYLHNKADYDGLAVYWQIEGAQRMPMDILHRDVEVVSASIGTVVAHNIGVVQALGQYLCLLFDRLHLPTILLAIKLKADLHDGVLTFLTA